MSVDNGSNESRPLLEDRALATVTPLPRAQLAALCIARLSEPISYTHVFPYMNEFLAALHVTDDPSKIGYYSGLVSSAAAIAQVITIFQWTKLSNVVGRRPVFLVGALGLTVVSLLFGLCRTFLQVLIVRTISGLLSGNIAVYQVVLAEITDSTNQAAAYPIFGCMYALGSTVGPLIGGLFSNLATTYPEYLGYSFLESFPYFLPGFICACISMGGFFMTYFFLEETLSSPHRNAHDVDPAAESLAKKTISMHELLSIPSIWALTWSSFAMSFFVTGHAVVFTLFCYTPIGRGGLGLSVAEIGYTLALSSATFVTFQILLMPTLLRTFDVARIYIFAMAAWPVSFALVPFLNGIVRLGLNLESPRSKLGHKILLWIGIAVVQMVSRVGWMCHSTNSILVRSNCPSPSGLGAASGLNQLVIALARCASPSFVSALFALSVHNELLGGHLWAVVMTALSAFGYYISRRVENPERNK